MIDYGEDFEKLWKSGTPSRLAGRKEAGYMVYCKMNKKSEKLRDQVKMLRLDVEMYRGALSEVSKVAKDKLNLKSWQKEVDSE